MLGVRCDARGIYRDRPNRDESDCRRDWSLTRRGETSWHALSFGGAAEEIGKEVTYQRLRNLHVSPYLQPKREKHPEDLQLSIKKATLFFTLSNTI